MEQVKSWAAEVLTAFRALESNSLISALLLLVVFLIIGTVAHSLIRRAIRAIVNRDLEERIDRLAATFLEKFAGIFVWLVVLMLYAHTVPYLHKLATALLASVSIASVVIGLALQSTLANVVAGVSLIFYKPFHKGDRLQITAPGGIETGVVEEVTLGYTVIVTYDNRRVVMANSQIAQTTMINLTSVTPRTMAMIPFSIGYDADIDAARASAIVLAVAHEDVKEVVSCPLVNLGASSVDFSLRVWCVDAGTAAGVKNDLLEAIKKRFNTEGIEIPYTYQNVVVKTVSNPDSS